MPKLIDLSVTGGSRSNSSASKKHSKKSTKPPSKNFLAYCILESIGALMIRYRTVTGVIWDKRVAISYSL